MVQLKVKPNFFIVGAQRSGTTALSEYLRSNPEVCFSKPKEPHYFADDFPLIKRVDTIDQYLDLFSICDKNVKAIGEGSTAYLQSKVALNNIKEFAPESKIIVMLRNPIDIVYSLHQHLFFLSKENIIDFERAWNIQDDRNKGKYLPKDSSHHFCLQYKEVGKIGTQIENLFRIFPKNQIHIILFEDFVKETKKTYDDTLEFLNLKNVNKINYKRYNYNREYRFNILNEILSNLNDNKVFSEILRRYKHFGGFNIGIAKLYRNVTTKKTNRQLLRPAFRNELREYFRSEILLLSRLIERDLSVWLKS